MSYENVVNGIGGRALAFDKKGARETAVAKMGCYLENDIRQVDNGNINPASVFYLEKQNQQYNLKGQGTDLHTITNGTYESSAGPINFPGYYTYVKSNADSYSLYITVNVTYLFFHVSLGDYYFCDNAGTFGVEKDASAKDAAQWYIEPATTFNVKPLAKVKDANGHYYTTLCVDFPFSIPSSGSTVLAAYTVTGKDANGNAVLNRLPGTVPGGTPVILECSSDNESTNVLNIESDEPAGKACAKDKMVESEGNYLKGRYFNAPAANYQYLNYQVDNPQRTNFATSGNFLTNDKTNYRVLNCVNGVVGFYKLKSETATMGANKAFLYVKGLPTVPASAKTFVMEGFENTTGIAEVHPSTQEPEVIYDLQGRRVNHPTHGIYIVNGKKVIINK